MSSHEFVKGRVIRKEGQIAGWVEYCSASHAEAKAAFLHWAECLMPHYGPIFEHMKRTGTYFKFTLHSSRANEDQVPSDSLALKLIGKQTKHFWKEANNLKGGMSTPLGLHIMAMPPWGQPCSTLQKHG